MGLTRALHLATARRRGPDPDDFLVSDDDRQFWAFHSPRQAPIPSFPGNAVIENPVDAFVLRKLQANDLGFSPPADRLKLIRRVTLDLTGLPPTPEEIQNFLSDSDPDSYEKLISRLLASPRYGERQAAILAGPGRLRRRTTGLSVS